MDAKGWRRRDDCSHGRQCRRRSPDESAHCRRRRAGDSSAVAESMPHVRARGSIVASLSDVPEAPAVKQMTIAQRAEVRLKILREKLDANVQHMTNTVMAAGNGGWRKKEEDIRHDDHSHQVKKRTKVDDVNTHGSSAVAEPAAGTRLCGHRRLPQQEPRREVSRIPPPPSTPAPFSSILFCCAQALPW